MEVEGGEDLLEPNIAKIERDLQGYDDNKLVKRQRNAEGLRDHPVHGASARLILELIAKEHERRVSSARVGRYKASTPEEGVLDAYGYKVGKSGLKDFARRKRLDAIMSEELPLVGSPAHMVEWGSPFSPQRYRKLHRVIQVNISSHKYRDNLEVAVADWEEDLDYLEREWRQRCIAGRL